MIRPLKQANGLGFFSFSPLPVEMAEGFDYEVIGRYHNYYFTPKKHIWPINYEKPKVILDGFSPNLNKFLHIGHLRNLALAKSFSKLFDGRFVALYGTALGIKDDAVKATKELLSFVGYSPEEYSDSEVTSKFLELPKSKEILKDSPNEEYAGCKIYEGLKNPVVCVRSNGQATYDLHDLAFAELIGPTHYLTGNEQKEHFENLGLGHKHLPMGLILDPSTGQKMKSRDGNALSATEALQMVSDHLKETSEIKKLAWNVLAWNFLRAGRTTNLKFNVDQWVQADQPGLYITYTYARLDSALKNVEIDVNAELSPIDCQLMGFCEYSHYWANKARMEFDTASLANYVYELCRFIGNLYHIERISNGRPGFQLAISHSLKTLDEVMLQLAMFPLTGI